MRQILLHNDGGPSDYTVKHFDIELVRYIARRRDCSDLEAFLKMASTPPIMGGSGTLSGYAQTHTIDGWNNKAAWPAQVNANLALCTVVPDSSKTGATITEANYTGYARQAIAAAGWNAGAAGGAGAASTTSSNGAITYAACTAGSSTILGWALCDAIGTGAGNMLWWGSATSTVISTTQTPATIASGGLTESLL